MPNIQISLAVTPAAGAPVLGGHIYVEAPDQSSGTAAVTGTGQVLDGTATALGLWAPIDCGRQAYVASQPWVIQFACGLNPNTAHTIRVYVVSYSADGENALVRYGQTGATPSITVTIPAIASAKPASGSNITPYLVTGVTAAVSTPVEVAGQLCTPIACTVDLSGLPSPLPADWAYQLLGFVNGDTSTTAVMASGLMQAGGLVPAGPDGIAVAHTFGPPTPTAITSITIYAVAGKVAGSRNAPWWPAGTSPGAFVANNIVPFITAACVVSIGTTGGVLNARAVLASSLSGVLGGGGGLPMTVNLAAPLYADLSNNLNFHFASDFVVAGGALTQTAVNLAKAYGFDTSIFGGGGGSSALTINGLAVNKLLAGTALFTGTATFASSSGPEVQIGAAGITIADNYVTPVNTVAVSSSGVSVSNVVSGITNAIVQVTSSGINLTGKFTSFSNYPSVYIGSSGMTLYTVSGNTAYPYLTVSGSGITIAGPSGTLLADASSVRIVNGSNSVAATSSAVTLSGATGTLTVDSTSFRIVSGSSSVAITSGGLTITAPSSTLNMGPAGVSIVGEDGTVFIGNTARNDAIYTTGVAYCGGFAYYDSGMRRPGISGNFTFSGTLNGTAGIIKITYYGGIITAAAVVG